MLLKLLLVSIHQLGLLLTEGLFERCLMEWAPCCDFRIDEASPRQRREMVELFVLDVLELHVT